MFVYTDRRCNSTLLQSCHLLCHQLENRLLCLVTIFFSSPFLVILFRNKIAHNMFHFILRWQCIGLTVASRCAMCDAKQCSSPQTAVPRDKWKIYLTTGNFLVINNLHSEHSIHCKCNVRISSNPIFIFRSQRFQRVIMFDSDFYIIIPQLRWEIKQADSKVQQSFG